jgi:RNA polymerase primary sigma factor
MRSSAASGGRHRSSERELDDYFDRFGAVELLDAEAEVRLAQRIEAGRCAAQRLSASGCLPPVEREALERMVAEGREARERFIAANLRLAVHFASRFNRAPGTALADVIQDGNVGLVQAVDAFDWRRGYRFSTYATWCIRQAIQRGTSMEERTIRLPYALHHAMRKVRAAHSRLASATGRDASIPELAAATNLTEQRVRRALKAPPDATSLDRTIGADADAAQFGAVVAVAVDDPAEETVHRLEIAAVLQEAQALLDDHSWHVLRLRFGLGADQAMTYAEIATVLGLSRETVRVTVKRALDQLRESVAHLAE